MRSEGHGARAWRQRWLAIALVGAAVAVASLSGGLVSATGAVVDGVSLVTSVNDLGVVTPESTSTATVVITNDSAEALPPGQLTVVAPDVDLRSVGAVDEWLSSDQAVRGTPLGSAQTGGIERGSSLTVSIPLDTSTVGWVGTWGVRALSITLDDGDTVAREHSAVLYAGTPPPGQIDLSLIAPITDSESIDPTLSADRLDELSAPGTDWAALANARFHSGLTYAIDPRVPVSIASQTQAGSTAQAWWNQIAQGAGGSFLTAFGDADLGGQIQAGGPLLLAGASDPDASVAEALAQMYPLDMSGASGSPTPTLSPDTPVTPSPESTPREGNWSPSVPSVAWLAPLSATGAVMDALAAGGYSRVMMSQGNIGDGHDAFTSALVNDTPVTVVSDDVSAYLSAAAGADSAEQWNHDMSLALVSLAPYLTDESSQRAVVASLPRLSGKKGLPRLDQVLMVVSNSLWIAESPLTSATRIPPVPTQILQAEEPIERLDNIRVLQDLVSSVTSFSAIAQTPEVITQPFTRLVMCALGVGIIGQPEWETQIGQAQRSATKILNGVHVATDSGINMIGATATLPIAIENDLPSAVTVTVTALPRNARLSVTNPVTVKIESSAQSVARMPASAQISNGSVIVDVSLASERGSPIGVPRPLVVTIHADWELIGLISLAVVFLALVAAGIIRTIRRRKGRPANG